MIMTSIYIKRGLVVAVFSMLFLLMLPYEVFADGGLWAEVRCSGTDCNFCHAVDLINAIVKWLFLVLAVIFGIIALIAGFRFVISAGNPGSISQAKQMLTNALIGLFIVLAAWITINYLMIKLTGGTVTIGDVVPWNDIPCASSVSLEGYSDNFAETVVEPSGAVMGYLPAGYDTAGGVGYVLDESEARAALEANGVLFKDSASVAGLRDSALNGAIALNNAVGGGLTVTSGTDGSHASGQYSHSEGYKLDFRTYDEAGKRLTSYLKSGSDFTRTGTWDDGSAVYTSKDGKSTCAIESDHVDCRFVP